MYQILCYIVSLSINITYLFFRELLLDTNKNEEEMMSEYNKLIIMLCLFILVFFFLAGSKVIPNLWVMSINAMLISIAIYCNTDFNSGNKDLIVKQDLALMHTASNKFLS